MEQSELDKELVRNLTDMAIAGYNGDGRVIAQEQKVIALIADLRAKLDAGQKRVAELERALKPFAECWTSPEPLYPLDEHYHNAAAILAGTETI